MPPCITRHFVCGDDVTDAEVVRALWALVRRATEGEDLRKSDRLAIAAIIRYDIDIALRMQSGSPSRSLSSPALFGGERDTTEIRKECTAEETPWAWPDVPLDHRPKMMPSSSPEFIVNWAWPDLPSDCP